MSVSRRAGVTNACCQTRFGPRSYDIGSSDMTQDELDAGLHRHVVRVQTALANAGATGEVRMLDDSARTAAEAAAALNVEVGQIANSLVFVADGEPLLVLTSGRHRVDTLKVAELLGVTK